MHHGSCLCGAIRYEVSGAIGPLVYCHCSMCRKASGSSFATNAPVDAAGFRFTAGEDRLGRYESSPGEFRCFCTNCGSPIAKLYAKTSEVRIRMGTLEGDPGIGPIGHVMVGSKAPWTRIADGLPQAADVPTVEWMKDAIRAERARR